MITEDFVSTDKLLDKYLIWIFLIDTWKKSYAKREYEVNLSFNHSEGGTINILCKKR